MDRLTGRDRNGEPMLLCAYANDNHCADCYDCGHFTKLVDRLAAYEDTGLEPERIGEVIDALKAHLYDLHQELLNYRKAESEGRLIVLPCKVGDTVWTMAQGIITSATVTRVKNPEITVRFDAFGYGHIRSTDDFGKTVFLTRQEAEAALGGDGDGKN